MDLSSVCCLFIRKQPKRNITVSTLKDLNVSAKFVHCFFAFACGRSSSLRNVYSWDKYIESLHGICVFLCWEFELDGPSHLTPCMT